jgi:hypothetical protein
VTLASAGDWGIVALLVLGIASWWSLIAYWILRHRVRPVDVEFPSDKGPDEALRDWAGYYTDWLASSRYTLVGEGLGTAEYARPPSAGWTIAVTVFLFPIGVLALFIRTEGTLVVRAVPGGSGIVVNASGNVHRDVAKELERDAAEASTPEPAGAV